MKQAAEHIGTLLSLPAINAVVGDDVYWELADAATVAPFLTYSVKAGAKITKEGIRNYEVAVRVFTPTLNTSAEIGDVVNQAITANSNWREQGVQTGYIDAEAKEAYLELTYTFKL